MGSLYAPTQPAPIFSLVITVRFGSGLLFKPETLLSRARRTGTFNYQGRFKKVMHVISNWPNVDTRCGYIEQYLSRRFYSWNAHRSVAIDDVS